jgi:Tfp pilus assembly protein FimT
MIEDTKVRDAQGRVIAIINRPALQTWLRFGTTDPSFPMLAARLRHARLATLASDVNRTCPYRFVEDRTHINDEQKALSKA